MKRAPLDTLGLELGVKCYRMKCNYKSVLQLIQLMDELQSTTAEKDNLLAEKSKDDLDNKAEIERLQGGVTSLSKEREQLKEDNKQLKTELEQNTERVCNLFCITEFMT